MNRLQNNPIANPSAIPHEFAMKSETSVVRSGTNPCMYSVAAACPSISSTSPAISSLLRDAAYHMQTSAKLK